MVPSASGTGICYQTEGGKLILLCVALLRDDPSYARHRGDVKIDMGGDGSQMQVLEQQVSLYNVREVVYTVDKQPIASCKWKV